ncbi:StfH/YfcO family fimbrial adhesin [Escherichia coli]|uniref:StfH/YfcO family fimbrial adhesin n=1 Tax=Escherichia coli TaxID=562 RepID=UPI001C9A6F4F|nr:StfH/YfcO family fimbrial adhesin [Escherichia coli]MBY7240856.1 StfH/YfcO family fimbrial adhesin [Escherichia coli]
MKLLRNFMGLLTLMVLSLTAQAESFQMYTPMGVPSAFSRIIFTLEVVTPAGVYTGTYQSRDPNMLLVGNLTLLSWNGPSSIPAPTIYLDHSEEINMSNCPGLAGVPSTNGRGWDCYAADLKVTVTGDVQGCPWLVSSQITTTDRGAVGATYVGPKYNNSTCLSIPLKTYDVSWDENTVAHKKTLNLQSADAVGGIIETTLSTYLMESQKLCDGSQFDDRGANCRFVSQMITFTASGCDDAKVTVTPVPHPITDKQLHDIVVRVDASALQPIDSTCRFQYVLNMF